MKMPFVCKMPLAACAMLFLVACGDSDSSTSGGQHIAKTIEGVSQKGPFLNGSSVTVQELNAKTLAQTGASFEGKIKNDKGEFSVSVESLSSPYVLLKANGYFRNEVTGKKSSGQMTLYALTDLENRDEVNVNILTHLEYERTIYLVSQKDMSVKEAKAQAKSEVLKAFGLEDDIEDSEDLNIFGTGKGNAALLAVSALMLSNLDEADFSERLANFAQDLEKDGTWDDVKTKAAIADWAYTANISAIRNNILSWNLDKDVPDIKKNFQVFWNHAFGLGKCNKDSAGKVSKVSNIMSQYAGTFYTCSDNAWEPATKQEYDTFGWKAGKDGEIKKGDVSGDNYIYDDDEWRPASTAEAKFGVCNKALRDSIKQVESVYYICREDGWATATQLEYDTYGWKDGKDGEIKKGDVSKLDYIYDKDSWRPATILEIDTYKWTKDTADGAWKKGSTTNRYYIFEKKTNEWREETSEAEHSSLNGCTILRQGISDSRHYADDINEVYSDTLYLCYDHRWFQIEDFNENIPKEAYFNPDIKYGTLKDSRDGKEYKTVVIGEGEKAQTWMAENLNYTDSVKTPSLKGESKLLCDAQIFQYYQKSLDSCLNFEGASYSWAAAIDSMALYEATGIKYGYNRDNIPEMPLRGVCPEGWHLPSTAEWEQLVKNVGGTEKDFSNTGYLANPLISKAAGKWMYKDGLDVSGTNSSGFSAIPTKIGLFEGKVWRYLFFIIADQNNPDYSEGKVRCIKD